MVGLEEDWVACKGETRSFRLTGDYTQETWRIKEMVELEGIEPSSTKFHNPLDSHTLFLQRRPFTVKPSTPPPKTSWV